MTPPKTLRYVNDKSGCWTELEGGRRIELTELEWRKAIVEHFRPRPEQQKAEPTIEGPAYGNILDDQGESHGE